MGKADDYGAAVSRLALKDDPDLLDAFISEVAAHTGIPAIQVEKDFWLTELLRGAEGWSAATTCSVVWKGGTSLCKAFGLIKRFSEDVDLIVALPAQTKGADDRLLKDLVIACQTVTGLESVVVPHETTRGIKRSARFAFDTSNSYGGESEGVLLQIGTGGGALPHSRHLAQSLVAEHRQLVDSNVDFMESDGVSILVLTSVSRGCRGDLIKNGLYLWPVVANCGRVVRLHEDVRPLV